MVPASAGTAFAAPHGCNGKPNTEHLFGISFAPQLSMESTTSCRRGVADALSRTTETLQTAVALRLPLRHSSK
jgi:hypothetical protein